MRLALVSHSLDGHRREYVELMTRLFEAGGVEPQLARHWRATLSERGPAFFLMIEESFPGYTAAALWRALRGRRTVGLLFRGREAVAGGSPRLRLKRWALRLLRRTRSVTTLSIVPFSIEPRLAMIADDWIDDPQLWDVDELNPAPTPLSEAVRAAAGGRRIVVSLGAQNAGKGFDFLTGTWRECPDLRHEWLFVAAGKVAFAAREAAARFEAEGGYLVDRFITDAELASLYRAADVIWGVYAPFYDQASGIFGRAVQYDAPILLRRGSAVEAHGRELGARIGIADYGAVRAVRSALDDALTAKTSSSSRVTAMRTRSVSVLASALKSSD